ncbi:MAG: hypothetical protein JRH01_14345 [Deltaproteobacteria bacterium]|nr:hypothetical protein [Deltaproteobacteria bacterium]MBW2418985.1 hypothetical protein [Deltaproteobacteria bacterium]
MKPTPASRLLAAASLALLIAATPLVACRRSARPIGVPLKQTSQFDSEMRRYRGFEPHKAIAVAGDVGGRYAMGYAQGLPSREAAIAEALAYCEQRRKDRRIEAECRLHAVGDEVVAD